MAWTDDPVRDFDAYDRECCRKISRYPKCDHCGEYIVSDGFYLIGSDNVCEECLDKYYRVYTENYIEEEN